MRKLMYLLFVLVLGAGAALAVPMLTGRAAGNLSVEIIAAPNLVVDSNALSPSTYAPKAATVIGKICNTGPDAATDVVAYIGDYTGSGSQLGTPGTYPSRTNPTEGSLTYRGTYAFEHIGPASDAVRHIGTLGAGECVYQYWSFEYPHLAVNDADGSTIPTWGESVKPDDDLSLTFDIWAQGSGGLSATESHTMTMRNEISAMANKIKPNGNPPGQWFNTDASTVLPGETITTNGILYRLGNVNQGFDNDGDGVPDYNAWVQPFGDPNFDTSCFRLVDVRGVLTVTRSAGNPDLIIPFEDNLYFTNLPEDNTDVRGEVYYTFLALGGSCTIPITPYQEVASGSDNEKFNGDYGTGVPALKTYAPAVTLSKDGPASANLGDTLTYTIDFVNTSSTAEAGLSLSSYGVAAGLMISDTVPTGLQYVGGSAASGNTIPSGNSVSIRYSTDGGTTWQSTDPGNWVSTSSSPVVIQWWLDEPLAVSGSGNNSGQVTYQAVVPSSGYSGTPFITNCAEASFGDAASFASSCDTTILAGTGSIGDTVWQDEDGDGIQDTGENGVQNVSVSLYWDSNGDGLLDDGDMLVETQTTDANGNYDFTSLPAATYFVVVDDTDSDLPTGYGPTTVTEYTVALADGQDYNDADFGFGPALQVAKNLTSINPAYVDQVITFTIDVHNLLPGDGTASGSCTYPIFAKTAIADSSDTPPGGNSANAQWSQPDFALYAPDGEYASSNISDNTDYLGLSDFNTGGKSGSITGVKVVLYVKELREFQPNNTLDVQVYYNNSPLGSPVSFGAADFADPVGSLYTLEADITSLRSWTWSDFANDFTELQLIANKGTSNTTGDIGVDAVAFEIVTNETCGGASSHVVTMPVTDTYDADLMQFLSAEPPVSGASVSGTNPNTVGTLTWDNLGPLYAGGTKSITLTFKALAVTSQTTNTVSVQNAYFGNGRRANDATDTATVGFQASGSIAGTLWADSNGTTGWEGTTGYGTGDAFISDVTVNLYACKLADGTLLPLTGYSYNKACEDSQNGGTWTLIASTTTDSNGDYLFEGLADGFYNVKVDETSLPAGFTTRSAEADPAGNGSGSTCGTCDGQWNSDTAALNSFNSVDNSSGGDDITEVSFGYQNASGNGSVFGYVWNDADGDGVWDSDEEPIAGVTMQLCDASNTTCITVDTDSDGLYRFDNVSPGDYYVKVYEESTDLPGMSQTGDPDESGTCTTCDGQNAVFTLSANEVEGAYDFGYQGGYSIGDTLYTDWDGDGTQDSGEEGISGVTLVLYRDWDGDGVVDSDDTLLASTTTDANGNYSFSGLPGNGADYIVKVSRGDLPTGYTLTGDPDETGACTTCDYKGLATLTTADDLSVDFGFQPTGYGSIGDTIWADEDADGVQDAGESGISNVTVNLYQDQDGDGVIDAEDALAGTATTDSNGNYTFSNLPAGNYIVEVDSANFAASGALENLTVSGDPDSTKDSQHAVSLAAAQSYTTADFGYTSSSIGDLIWQDNDGDGNRDNNEPGISGVVVELYADANNDGNPDGAAIATDTTDSDGLYLFGGLAEGNYIVKVADSNFLSGGALYNYTQTGDPDAGSQPCSGGDCDNTSVIEGYTTPDSTFFYGLQLGQNDMSNDFGYKPLGVIGDTLWIDSDGDGTRDTGETGIANVTVKLCSDAACTSVVATTETDANGEYSFGGVADGTYFVQVDTADTDFPSGLTQTYMPDGGSADNTADNVVISGGSVASIGGTACSNCDLDVDFGYRFSGTNSISGTAWHDDDSGGQSGGIGDIDAGETVRYDGVPVYLWRCVSGCGGSDDILVGSTTTDSNGQYAFNNLADGEYRVVANANAYSLSGTSATTPTSYASISLSGGASATRDFGFISSMDFGDLPSSYNSTTLADNGARHTISSLYLGSTVDADPNGQESSNATGDDTDGTDDDDGVTPASSWSNGANGARVDVTVTGCSGTCYLSAWVDWNNDGDFNDPDERVLLDQSVTSGTQSLTFDVPDNTIGGSNKTFNTRFRLYPSSTSGLAQPTGLVSGGEVEDYQWTFSPTAVDLSEFSATSGNRVLLWLAGVLAFIGLMAGAWRWRNSKRAA